jgi:hypothetical protein
LIKTVSLEEKENSPPGVAPQMIGPPGWKTIRETLLKLVWLVHCWAWDARQRISRVDIARQIFFMNEYYLKWADKVNGFGAVQLKQPFLSERFYILY